MEHIPVLLEKALELLAPGRGGVFVDCTLGLGGHAEALLAAAEGTRLIGIDRDPEALSRAAERLRPFAERVVLLEGEFEDLERLLAERRVGGVAGVLADLGVSSLQLDSPERGFSFRLEGPLDMRMGAGELTAGDVVNRYAEVELERIFRLYGEERQARAVARAIARARSEKRLETTTELAALIARVKRGRRPAARRRIDPATRVFQALRIEVNRELAGLESFIRQAVRLLERDGRLVVISYHSLEDRIVKNTLRDLARGTIDEVTGRTRSETRAIELLTRKPLRPDARELELNPRSRSARLRAARRI